MKPSYKPRRPLDSDDVEYVIGGLQQRDRDDVEYFANRGRRAMKAMGAMFGEAMSRELIVAMLRYNLKHPDAF